MPDIYGRLPSISCVPVPHIHGCFRKKSRKTFVKPTSIQWNYYKLKSGTGSSKNVFDRKTGPAPAKPSLSPVFTKNVIAKTTSIQFKTFYCDYYKLTGQKRVRFEQKNARLIGKQEQGLSSHLEVLLLQIFFIDDDLKESERKKFKAC